MLLTVANDAGGPWKLTVKANGAQLEQETIGDEASNEPWRTIAVDLSALAGRKVDLELLHGVADDRPRAAYWCRWKSCRISLANQL